LTKSLFLEAAKSLDRSFFTARRTGLPCVQVVRSDAGGLARTSFNGEASTEHNMRSGHETHIASNMVTSRSPVGAWPQLAGRVWNMATVDAQLLAMLRGSFLLGQ